MRAKQKGVTIVVITQRPALLNIVDKVLILRSGRAEAFGPPQRRPAPRAQCQWLQPATQPRAAAPGAASRHAPASGRAAPAGSRAMTAWPSVAPMASRRARRLRWPTLLGPCHPGASCIGGFGVWAAIAPLEGAVVVSGSFVATGQNKHVQHLEGGILREMLVEEGDLVEPGQPLLRLDPTAASSQAAPPGAEEIPPAHHEGAARGRDRRPARRSRMPAESRRRSATDPEVAAIFERQSRRAAGAARRSRRRRGGAAQGDRRPQESIGGYAAQAQSTTEQRWRCSPRS